MIKNVRNIESARIIWFEGADWVPMAVRRKESTTEIRVNDVVIIRSPGASDRIVSNRNIWIVTATSFGLVAVPTPMLRDGNGIGSA
jgi:hypothetical protein